MSSARAGESPAWTDLGRRLDELKAVLPVLADLPLTGPETAPAILDSLIATTETLRRQVIRDRIRLSSFQEMMEALLRSQDAERVLENLTIYLRRLLGLGEVLILRRGKESGWWMGYYAGEAPGPVRLGVIAWSNPRAVVQPLRSKADEAEVDPAAAAETAGERSRREAAGITEAAHYAYVLPLGKGPTDGSSGTAGEPVGILCLNRAQTEGGEEDWSPEDVAHSVSAMLETLRHREEIEAAETFRRQLLEAMRDGLLAVDASGKILEVNVGISRFVSISPGLLRGRPLDALSESAPALVQHLRRALTRREAPAPREVLLGPQHSRIPVHVAASALRDESARFQGLVVNLTDLTPVRAMEEEIRRLDRLAALGRFAAGVAHEIRNPLAGIGAGVEYLARRYPSDAPEQEDLRFVTSEIRRLNGIVSDLLDYTHPRPLDLQVLDASWIAGRVRLGLEPHLRARRVTLKSEGEEKVAFTADPERLEQVLLNLVKNAVEASPTGGEVRLRWEHPRLGGSLRFRVEDDGPGMTEEERARAFEPFFTTKGSGTGLGLYLSHAIVQQHGGRLALENRPGRGTVAVLELPLGGKERQDDHAVVHLDH